MAAGKRRIKEVVAFNRAIDDDRVIAAIRDAEQGTTGQIRVHVSGRAFKDLERAARRRFAKLGMDRTPGRNAVLLYVQPRRHRFFIVGDTGLDPLGGAALWEPAASKLSEDLKERRYTDGIVGAVRYAGEVLAEHFPSTPDAPEPPGLPDEVTGD